MWTRSPTLPPGSGTGAGQAEPSRRSLQAQSLGPQADPRSEQIEYREEGAACRRVPSSRSAALLSGRELGASPGLCAPSVGGRATLLE